MMTNMKMDPTDERAGAPGAGAPGVGAPASDAADRASGHRPKLEALLLHLLQSLYAAEQELPAVTDQIRARTSSALLQTELHACRIQALNHSTHLEAAFAAMHIEPKPQKSATAEIVIQRINQLIENTPTRATEFALILSMQQLIHQQMATQLAAGKIARVLGHEALAWQLEQAAVHARSTDHHLGLIAIVCS